MNKQQEKAYKEYLENMADLPEESKRMTKEEWLAVEEQREEEEKQAYLDYQKKIGENNAKLPEGKEPEKTLNKEDWLKRGKPTGETKAERFIRLVEPRTNKVLDAIDKLESLASPNYESSIEQRAQVLTAIQEKLTELETVYAGKKAEKAGFKLQTTLTQDQP